MTELSAIHPSNFSSEEWHLVQLLGKVGGEWPWHMTDEEYALVSAAIARVREQYEGRRAEHFWEERK